MQAPTIPPVLVDIEEAAHALRISRAKFYDLLKSGEIERVKIGTRALIRVAELERYAASLAAPEARGGRAA